MHAYLNTPESRGTAPLSVRSAIFAALILPLIVPANVRGANGVPLVWGDDKIPLSFYELTKISTIAAGDFHCVAVRPNGSVIGWGYNGSGQSDVPTGLTSALQVAAGGYHSLAVKPDGTVLAWGQDFR